MKQISTIIFASVLLSACGGSDSAPEGDASVSKGGQKAVANNADACRASANAKTEIDGRQADLACAMTVTDKVTISLVGTDGDYCAPWVVAVAPKNSPIGTVSMDIDHGTEEEAIAVVLLDNKVLSDRKSSVRSYGLYGTAPLEPCATLPMKVVNMQCKLEGEKEFKPCGDDVELLPSGLFASEEYLK